MKEGHRDITLAAHRVVLPNRVRDHVDEKADKVLALAERAQTFQVKVSRKNSSRGHGSEDSVELTVIDKGPVMTAEEAADQVELVGHDFFLFVDAENHLSSVVDRREASIYRVIALSA